MQIRICVWIPLTRAASGRAASEIVATTYFFYNYDVRFPYSLYSYRMRIIEEEIKQKKRVILMGCFVEQVSSNPDGNEFDPI